METRAKQFRYPLWRMHVIVLMAVASMMGVTSCATTTGSPKTITKPVVRSVPAIDISGPKNSDVIILVSDKSAAYAGVASILSAQMGAEITIHNMHGDITRMPATRQRIQAMPQRVVVAVGLLAAETASKLNGKSVVFCQVFNYAEYDLIQPWMKGVSATPPVAEQFRDWRKLDPRLKRIGLIIGPGLDDLETEARAAARLIGAELLVRESRSDKETRFLFGKLEPSVDGFWLVPDNRILSSDVLRDMLATAVKRGKRVAVFNQDVMRLGGVLSAEADPRDVAEQIVARVRDIRSGPDVPGPDMKSLTRARITVNGMLARELGLVVPPSGNRRHES
jgi:ABC-type uncharacterized transport system substrate-binding protein